MTKRLLFSSFDYLRPKDPTISLASASILANLKSTLHQQQPSSSNTIASLLDIQHVQYNVRQAQLNTLTSQFLSDVENFKPDIIASGICIWNESFIQHGLASLKKTTNKFPLIILGGPQITYNSKGTLELHYPAGDVFIRGYAEQSFSSLIVALLKASVAGATSMKEIKPAIPGVYYAGNSNHDTGEKSLYDFASLPSPLLYPGVPWSHNQYIRLETKRGCPFTCSFCQHKDSYEKRGGVHADRVKEEVDWISAQRVQDISIVDPIFNSGPDGAYLKVLSYFIQTAYAGRLSLQSRFEMVRNEYLDACSKLLDNGVALELEFGIQTIAAAESKIIQRKNNLKRVLESAAKLKERQFPFQVSLIYGLPNQTLDSFKYNVEWVQEFLAPNTISAWPLMLLKGTALYEVKEEFKLRKVVLDEDLEFIGGELSSAGDEKRIYQGIPHVVESNSFTESDWLEMKAIATSL